ncbi:hypothetical protein HDU93_001650 [Gonapodya sp. JEL0774]|nr:hypothetical protein HDU93_001650 [Gonapodya sp. JEL0774]
MNNEERLFHDVKPLISVRIGTVANGCILLEDTPKDMGGTATVCFDGWREFNVLDVRGPPWLAYRVQPVEGKKSRRASMPAGALPTKSLVESLVAESGAINENPRSANVQKQRLVSRHVPTTFYRPTGVAQTLDRGNQGPTRQPEPFERPPEGPDSVRENVKVGKAASHVELGNNPSCVMYGFGVDWDFTWEDEFWEMTGCETHSVLKIDVEGFEWDSLARAFHDGVMDKVEQVLLEVHMFKENYRKWKPQSVTPGTKQSTPSKAGSIQEMVDINIDADTSAVLDWLEIMNLFEESGFVQYYHHTNPMSVPTAWSDAKAVVVFFCLGRYLPQAFLVENRSTRLRPPPSSNHPPPTVQNPPVWAPEEPVSSRPNDTNSQDVEPVAPPELKSEVDGLYSKNPWKLYKARDYEKFSFMPHGQWNADAMWTHLLKECKTPESSIVVEIGSYGECWNSRMVASAKGLFKYIRTFKTVPSALPLHESYHGRRFIALNHLLWCTQTINVVKETQPQVAARIELLQLAVAAEPEGELEFHGTGGTGDHAGSLNEGEIDAYRDKKNDIVVKSTNLDTIFKDSNDDIFMVKIDTQGFDGVVLLGMKDLLSRSQIQYVIMEFWPVAMKRTTQPCRETLQYISQFAYKAYEGILMALNYLSTIDINDPIPGGKGESYKQSWEKKKKDIESVCKWYEARLETLLLCVGALLLYGAWSSPRTNAFPRSTSVDVGFRGGDGGDSQEVALLKKKLEEYKQAAIKWRRIAGKQVCDKDLLCKQKDSVGPTGGWCLEPADNPDWFKAKFHMLPDPTLSAGILKYLGDKPTVLVDIGAGIGQYGMWFRDKANNAGNIEWHGFDGAENVHEFTDGLVTWTDATDPLFDMIPIRGDWVMSLEVGEHIPPEKTDNFLDTLVRHSRTGVIVSWGIPGQPGHAHINCRPNSEIIKLMADRGYIQDSWTREFQNHLRTTCSYFWLKETVMVFKRAKPLQ